MNLSSDLNLNNSIKSRKSSIGECFSTYIQYETIGELDAKAKPFGSKF